jgi:hypothetical protein
MMAFSLGSYRRKLFAQNIQDRDKSPSMQVPPQAKHKDVNL